MHRTVAFVICLIVITTAADTYWKGVTNFASDLFFECASSTNSNVIISSFSVANVIAMLSLAADGNTYKQLKTGLQLKDKNSTAAEFRAHHDLLKAGAGNATFSMVNQIYVQQGYKINKTLQALATKNFHAGIQSLNFTDKDTAAQTINRFVKENTNGRIENLIEPDMFTTDSRAILINAIYFKGDWLFKFDADLNENRTFYNLVKNGTDAEFMHMQQSLNFGKIEDLDAKAIELEYAGSSFSMLFILPRERYGLPELEEQMKEYDLTKVLDQMDFLNAYLWLPKFKIEFSTHLNDALRNLGMDEMFTRESHLRGLLQDGEPILISDTIHKAFIEVNEGGSESGAATGFLADRIVGGSDPEFNAEHPFLFYILHKDTKTPIFSGRITEFD